MSSSSSSAKILITPGQPISRQMPSALVGLADAKEWEYFCDAYDRIVVLPFRRAKLTIAGSFLVQLLFLMGILTMTDSVPTGFVFLLGPLGFLAVAAAAMAYMYWTYPRAVEELGDLCYESNLKPSNRQRIAFQYQHNHARRDLSDDFIEITAVQEKAESGLFRSPNAEWNPLMQIRSLWNRSQK